MIMGGVWKSTRRKPNITFNLPMNRNVSARFNLFCMEGQAGNEHRAYSTA